MAANPNIAIDGPAGSGKSTVALMVAKELGFLYIDTGAMYRAVTLQALREGIDLNDWEAVERVAASASIELVPGGNSMLRVLLNGEDVTQEIRSPEVSRNVSLVARVPAVRKRLVELQRSMACRGGVVMEGRDIGTVVLPDAQVKIFLTASPGERARRRREELLQQGANVDLRQVEEEILTRDKIDTQRDTAPLKPALDAEVIDSSTIPAEQVVKMILARVSAWRQGL
ncbi:MAG TPA: (d)CMP kinase [Bacillota bacterium]|jgi:cytidylate kinase|nr:(d)CMP kinase [Peptococcaceae bacterium MAG4]NLW38151.1 (d)CMP kinase [Peptococcaceae bacterium]HPZ43016.1 (d)CMP kinase [Bacillota bacterium]HQD75545.1 (d)CMP kinase [Bacillota bacterium]HUM57840.1 (d)CMP kinase [Bacillota bacterium]